jgi:hypothetical protein
VAFFISPAGGGAVPKSVPKPPATTLQTTALCQGPEGPGSVSTPGREAAEPATMWTSVSTLTSSDRTSPCVRRSSRRARQWPRANADVGRKLAATRVQELERRRRSKHLLGRSSTSPLWQNTRPTTWSRRLRQIRSQRAGSSWRNCTCEAPPSSSAPTGRST